MPKTAIVNPRRRRRTNRRRRSYGRRRNPATPSASGDRTYNRRRRRRNYGSRRRRRNPAAPASSVYSSTGYRKRNPDLFDVDRIMETMPAATLGIWAARWAAKIAGPFEDRGAGKVSAPGIKHAIAMIVGAQIGSQAIGSFLGDNKAPIAYASALGFAGDLFARKRVFDDSKWVQENLLLAGVDDDAEAGEGWDQWDEGFSGFEEQSELGADPGQLVVGPDGTIYQLSGIAPDPAQLPGGVGGFEDRSALGGMPSGDSSFGYV